MIELCAYSIVALALTVALWALPIWWFRSTAAADTYRREWTTGRDQHYNDDRDALLRRRAS